MTTSKKIYSAEFLGVAYEVKPFNEKYLQSLFSVLSDLRDPSADSYAIQMLKNVAVPSLPDSIAKQSATRLDWYEWDAFLPFEEIFSFVAQVMKCQRLYMIDNFKSKTSLTAQEQNHLAVCEESLKMINKAISAGKVEDAIITVVEDKQETPLVTTVDAKVLTPAALA